MGVIVPTTPWFLRVCIALTNNCAAVVGLMVEPETQG